MTFKVIGTGKHTITTANIGKIKVVCELRSDNHPSDVEFTHKVLTRIALTLNQIEGVTRLESRVGYKDYLFMYVGKVEIPIRTYGNDIIINVDTLTLD